MGDIGCEGVGDCSRGRAGEIEELVYLMRGYIAEDAAELSAVEEPGRAQRRIEPMRA